MTRTLYALFTLLLVIGAGCEELTHSPKEYSWQWVISSVTGLTAWFSFYHTIK
jgi:hypothetical protein